jgi:hypothetical protein
MFIKNNERCILHLSFLLSALLRAPDYAKVPNFLLYHTFEILSSGNFNKDQPGIILKFVQDFVLSLLIFKKFFDIIILQGKGNENPKPKKNFKKYQKTVDKQKVI